MSAVIQMSELEIPKFWKEPFFPPYITTVSPSLGPSGFICTCLLVLSEQCFLNGCESWGPVQPVMGRQEGALGAGTLCDSHRPSPSPQVSFFLFIIFVVYTMLPFNMRDAVIASVLTSSSHTVVLSVCLSSSPGAEEHLVWQVGASLPPHGDLPRPSGDGVSATHLLQVWLSAGAWQVLQLCSLVLTLSIANGWPVPPVSLQVESAVT